MNKILNLEGKFIFSTPLVTDPLFEKSIIFLNEVQETTSYGFFIDFYLNNSEIVENIQKTLDKTLFQDSGIYLGGPISTEQIFVLHSTEISCEFTYSVNDSVYVTKLEDAIDNFVVKPEFYKIMSGYCEWHLGQLEKEIRSGYWITSDFNPDLLFGSVKNKWNKCLKEKDLHPMSFSYQCGKS